MVEFHGLRVSLHTRSLQLQCIGVHVYMTGYAEYLGNGRQHYSVRFIGEELRGAVPMSTTLLLQACQV